MICFLKNCPHRKAHQKKLGYCRTFCVKVSLFQKSLPQNAQKRILACMHAGAIGYRFLEKGPLKNVFFGSVALLEKVPTKKTVFWVLSHCLHCDRFLEKVP